MKKQTVQLQQISNFSTLDAILAEDGFFIVDKQLHCLYISENAFLDEKQRRSLLGKSIWDIFPTLRKTEVYKKALLVIKTGKKQELEYQSSIIPACFDIHMYPVKEGIAVFFHNITKQKETEEKLQESRYRYKTVIETSNDIISLIDMEGKIIYVSPSIRKILGFTQKELIGTNRMADTLPEDQEKIQKGIEKARQGKSVFFQYSAKHKGGHWVQMELSAKILLDRNKKPYLFVVTSRDITKRLEYDKKLKESEEKFRALIEHSLDIYELLDAQGKILYISDSFEKVFGLNSKKYVGRNVFDLIHTDDKERIYRAYKHVLEKPGNAETVIYRTWHPKRKWIWLEATGINYLHNPALSAIVVIYRDITGRKVAEEKLLESEERLRALADNIPNLVWITNEQGRVFWYNSRWYEYTGKTPEQMEGEGWKSVYDPQELSTILTEWRFAMKNKKPLEMVISIMGSDGVFRPFLTRVVPVKDKNRKVIQWFGTNTDITQQKKIEQRKDDFIALASHELKTPLTSTKILTQVLRKRFANNPDAALLLGKMDNQIDKLASLVTEMLDISKIEQGKLELKNEKFYLRTVAEEVVDDLQQITQHKLIMDWQTKEYFMVDKDRVRQVLINFITNAIKYSPEKKDIVIRSHKVGDDVVVSVQDFGAGIPKQEQQHIFDRFYQVHTSKGATYPGLGLGLYINKELITRMGGKVWVESEVGKGSTFSFSLPIHKK